MIPLQIKSSLVPISNHPIDLALTLKEKNYTDNTLGKVFLLNSVRRLQKLSDLYRWGALLKEFRVRGKPRSATPRMKHTRVPRTVRRDIWRLAIETSSIPSLYIFEAESEIRSKVESKTVNKPNEPSRKSNRLKQEKIPRTLGHVELLLGPIDVVQCLRYLRREPSFKNNVASRGIQFAVRYCRPKESALRKLCTNIDQPYLIWDAVLCRHVPPPKDQGYWDAQSNRLRRR